MPQKQLTEFTKKYDGKVAKLFTLGRVNLGRSVKFSYVEEFGFTHDDVEQLLMLAKDKDIYHFDFSGVSEYELLEFYGVLHAWHALSELEAIEAKEFFINTIEECGYQDDYDDWILSDFRSLIKPYRKDMFEYLAECSQLDRYGAWTRVEYISTIGDMLNAKEVEPQKVDELIVKILSSDDNALVNASVISICIDERLIHHHAVIKKCFERRAVDIDYIGDLEDVEIAMGLRECRKSQRELTEADKKFQFIRDKMFDFLDDTEKPALPFVNTEPKIGRNDPCPCGSGKKYKKCCLDK
jgi:hypothetical protein